MTDVGSFTAPDCFLVTASQLWSLAVIYAVSLWPLPAGFASANDLNCGLAIVSRHLAKQNGNDRLQVWLDPDSPGLPCSSACCWLA